MERPGRAFFTAGTGAVVLTVLGLGLFSAAEGLSWWMPLNATSHAFHGPEAAEVAEADWAHTGSGTLLHVLSCLFWAGVAVLLLYLVRRWLHSSGTASWTAGLGTAVIAGIVDYGLIPARLTPGWELVLGWQGVLAGLGALGVGLALGLHAASGAHRQSRSSRQARSATRPTGEFGPKPADTALERRRHRPDGVIDQRMQRIDPAGKVSKDPDGTDPGPPIPPKGRER